ncbi:MAG: hypothetical protein WD359_10585, partial [Dehalococcoidia bacterium]
EFSSLLADGLTEIDDSVLEVATSVVPSGDYLAVLLDFNPRLVSPGSEDDYFANEYRRTADREHDPRQAYYRGTSFRSQQGQGFHELVVPLYDSALCDSARVNEFRLALRGGSRPTALAVSFCDVVDRGGWFGIDESRSDYAREFHPDPQVQWVLTHYLLDGHHRYGPQRRKDERLPSCL